MISSRESFRVLLESNLVTFQAGVQDLRNKEKELSGKIEQVVSGKLTVGFVGNDEPGNIHGLIFSPADKRQTDRSILGQLNSARDEYISQLFEKAVPGQDVENAMKYIKEKYNKAQEKCLIPSSLNKILKKIEAGQKMKTDIEKSKKEPKVVPIEASQTPISSPELINALNLFWKKGEKLQVGLDAVKRGEKILELLEDETLTLDQRINIRQKKKNEFAQDNSDVQDLLQKIRILLLKEILINAGISKGEEAKIMKFLDLKEMSDSRFLPPSLMMALKKLGYTHQIDSVPQDNAKKAKVDTDTKSKESASKTATKTETEKVTNKIVIEKVPPPTKKEEPSIKKESSFFTYLLTPFRFVWNWFKQFDWVKRLFGIK